MPINALKIDTAFVKNMLSNEQDSIIVRSTIALAHNLNLNVIAEGVEDIETMERLREMDCDQVQGYHIGKPEPWSEIESWLNKDVL
jgi:EAL domain-containing protein (putative c-di-GMP-specific phosphodiesterase class I)